MIDFIFHLTVCVIIVNALLLLADIFCFYTRKRWGYNWAFWTRVSAISLSLLLIASMVNLGCIVYLVVT